MRHIKIMPILNNLLYKSLYIVHLFSSYKEKCQVHGLDQTFKKESHTR